MRRQNTAVVILNWNGREHLRTYLPSVLEHSVGARVIVADNGSDDDSAAVVAGFSGCEWLALRQNFGFAEGYNRALAQIDAEVYVMLNSDVRVTEGWLDAPLARLSADAHVGAVQPKILADQRPEMFEYAGAAGGFLDALGYPYCRGRVFEAVEADQAQYDDAVPVDWASGACCFVRATLWHALGGLDGDFFAHMEEIDFCWRLRRTGFSCWVEPSSVVFHLGGGTLAYQSPRKTYLNFRNSLATLAKNLPTWQLPIVLLLRLLLDGVAGLKFLFAGEPKQIGAILRAHFHFYAWLPKLLKARVLPQGAKALGKQDSGAKAGDAGRPISVVWSYYALGRRRYSEL